MSNPVGRALLAILRGIGSLIPDAVTDRVDAAVDFAYVKVLGLPFIVLGYRQTGKTTLMEWLHNQDFEGMDDFEPDPTAAGGEVVPVFRTTIGEEGMRIKPKRDVGGEYAMWETDWVDLLQDAKPRGIIFMLDHDHPYHHKDALNFVLQMLDDEVVATRRLKWFMVLANKSDLWSEEKSLDDLLDDYRNETRRLASQSERIGYGYEIRQSSLKDGDGIQEAMDAFFTAIRPRKQKTAAGNGSRR